MTQPDEAREVGAYTPGPWIAEQHCSGGRVPDAGCGVIATYDEHAIRNPSRGMVAWVTRHVGMPNSEVEANARLIAAAPDLLRACQAVVAALDDRVHSSAALIALDMARTAAARISTGVDAARCQSRHGSEQKLNPLGDPPGSADQ